MGFFADFFGSGEPPPQYQPLPMPQRFLQPSSVPEMQINDVRRGILSDKRGWDDANKTINFLTKSLENPDLSDLQKQTINDELLKLNQTRDAFAESANERRANAQALGIDVSDYDSGKTLQEATQAYSTYRNNAVKDFLNLPTVQQLEENRYLELRNKGASPSMAKSIIRDERAGREEEFLRRAEEGIMTYGTNPDGSINDIGLSLMHNALSSSPQTAQLFGTAFALPRNIFEANNARDLAILNNDAVAERQAAQIIAQWKNAEANRQAKEKNLKTTLRHKTENTEYVENRKDARTEFVEGKKDARTAAALDSRERIELAKLKAGSPAYKFGEYYNLGLELFGGDKKKAQDYAMTQTSKWKPGESKVSAAQGVFNIYDTMLSYIEQGDEDTAGHMLQRLTTNEEEKLNEFSADFTSEENMKISELRTAFSEYLNFTPTSSDTNEINKQRADARDRLQAKYLAVKRGTKYEDELLNIRRKRFDERRRNGKENNATDTSQADKNVRALLGDGGKNNDNPNKTYTPPPITGTGYSGSYVP